MKFCEVFHFFPDLAPALKMITNSLDLFYPLLPKAIVMQGYVF